MLIKEHYGCLTFFIKFDICVNKGTLRMFDIFY